MQEWAESFYNGKAWNVCRDSYRKERMRIDGGRCEKCRENHGKIVHHVIWLTEMNISDPEVTLNFNNLMYVCKDCHERIHHKDVDGVYRSQNRYKFDEDGMPVPLKDIDGMYRS